MARSCNLVLSFFSPNTFDVIIIIIVTTTTGNWEERIIILKKNQTSLEKDRGAEKNRYTNVVVVCNHQCSAVRDTIGYKHITVFTNDYQLMRTGKGWTWMMTSSTTTTKFSIWLLFSIWFASKTTTTQTAPTS